VELPLLGLPLRLLHRHRQRHLLNLLPLRLKQLQQHRLNKQHLFSQPLYQLLSSLLLRLHQSPQLLLWLQFNLSNQLHQLLHQPPFSQLHRRLCRASRT
jgi:hypothetical protein